MSAQFRERLVKWETLLKESLQFDQWGQVVEASEKYLKLLDDVQAALKEKGLDLNSDQRSNLHKFQTTLSMRMQGFKTRPVGETCDYSAMVQVKDIRRFLVDGEPWPIRIDTIQVDTDSEGEGDEDAASGPFSDNRGRLLPPPKLGPGHRILKITIQSIGLKDAATYLDPFITVSVRKGPGELLLLESEQHTPHPKARQERQVVFQQPVFIQTPIDNIPSNANIFFEFKHFKPKKNKISTRCWSMLSPDELTEGDKELEIYAKPTDYTAKKFSRLSVKELYLVVNLTILSNTK